MALVSVGCNPGSVAYRQARQAELRKDYDTAVIDYGKALQYEPQNSRYLIHQQDARARAAEFHVTQGRRLLAENRPDAAAGEFEKAAGIDPTNETAKQELARILAAQAAEKGARQRKLEEALKPKQEAPPAGLKPFPAEPLAHFRISADSRKVFETLGKLAELNVAFNYDFQPRPISLDLSNVKLEDAMRTASYEAHVFWKAISPNTVLIVPDTPTNRREYEDEVLKTIHLSNPLAAADRTQISTALKQVLGLQRIIDNPNSNSIIIRDTPDKVAAAEQMIRSLDLGKAEILIDISVLEASRQRMQSLGISPVTISASGSATPGFQTAVTYAPPGTTTTSTTGTTTTTVQSAPALNQLTKLSTADFAIALPSIAAQAIMSDDHTRILQNPEVRVTDGLTAKLRIGSRVPYATGSFLPSFGGATGSTGTTGGIGLLASTQFQYQDVGVNLDITPHLTADGEIALHAKIEISSVGAAAMVGGLSQPTFNQRIIEHDIQLKEGEVSLLGGLIQTQTERSVAGLPGLADIPLLRYLFSSVTSSLMDNEVLVMLNPHIIRLPDVAPSTEATVSQDSAPGPVPFEANPGEPQ